uniref:Uncharacterized protein n=1 Tax=uncultured marine crenarchaeote E6-3G TaxID=907719 RepID=G9BAM2_9ARCH|nr:hypothetical protein E6-3G_23 [uncultured marine crenarchaeote E6-3G]
MTSVAIVQAKSETYKNSNSGSFEWTYSGPYQDYYTTTYWKWTYHEVFDTETGTYKGVFHWQETNKAYGEDGKRYIWHNKQSWVTNQRSGVYHDTFSWADPWGYRELYVYRYANGEVRVEFFRVLQAP